MAVREALNEYAYQAQIAGLAWSFTNSIKGFLLGVSGFDEKLVVLLDRILMTVRDPNTYADEPVFARVYDRFERQLKNMDKEEPFQLAVYEATVFLNTPRWHVQEKLAALSKKRVSTLELCSFVQLALDSAVGLDSLVMGNVTRMDALAWSEKVWQCLSFDVFRVSRPRVLALPIGKTVECRLPPRDEKNNNSAVEFLVQFAVDDVRSIAMMYVVASCYIGEGGGSTHGQGI